MTHTTSDPLAELVAESARRKVAADCATILQQCRTALLLAQSPAAAYHAGTILTAPVVLDEQCPALAATDGTRIFLKPSAITALSPDAVLGLLVHEAAHIIRGDAARATANGWDHRRANIAADLVINQQIREAGLILPPGGCLPGEGEFRHHLPTWSMDEHYSALSQDPGPGKPGDGDGRGYSSPDALLPDPRHPDDAAAAAQVAQKQAAKAARDAHAKQQGAIPAWLQIAIQQDDDPPQNWRAILRRHLTLGTHRRTWATPSRRLLAAGAGYWPGRRKRKDALAPGVILWDLSGSMGQSETAETAREILAIAAASSRPVTIISHDAQVTSEIDLRPGATLPDLAPAAIGGGGTCHREAFERAAARHPAWIVALTDCHTSWPTEPPRSPVYVAHPAAGSGSVPAWATGVPIE